VAFLYLRNQLAELPPPFECSLGASNDHLVVRSSLECDECGSLCWSGGLLGRTSPPPLFKFLKVLALTLNNRFPHNRGDLQQKKKKKMRRWEGKWEKKKRGNLEANTPCLLEELSTWPTQEAPIPKRYFSTNNQEKKKKKKNQLRDEQQR